MGCGGGVGLKGFKSLIIDKNTIKKIFRLCFPSSS